MSVLCILFGMAIFVLVVDQEIENGKNLPALHILSLVEPIVNNFPKPSRLSQMIFDVVQVLLSYTDVELRGSVNFGAMGCL
jgi:hypothetical protein